MPSEVSQCVSAVGRTHIDRSLCKSGLPETSSLSPRRTYSALRTAGSKCPSFNNGHEKRAFLALWALFRSHDPAENERNVRICHPETDCIPPCAWAMGFDTTALCSTQIDARRAEHWKFARRAAKCEPVKSGPTGPGLSSSKRKRMTPLRICRSTRGRSFLPLPIALSAFRPSFCQHPDAGADESAPPKQSPPWRDRFRQCQ